MAKAKPTTRAKKTKPPIVGQIVHYRLSAADIETLTARRPTTVTEGELVPLLVTSVGEGEAAGTVSGMSVLFSDEHLWVTNVPAGEGPGTWNPRPVA